MVILSWNIQHGGGKRVSDIANSILKHNPDLILIGEYRQRPADAPNICKALSRAGYVQQTATVSEPRKNGLLLASKEPFASVCRFPELNQHDHRVIEVQVNGVAVLACYFPQRQEKVPVFQFLLRWAADKLTVPALIVGDLNTGKHGIDEAGRTFVATEYIDEIETLGFVDGWRMFNGGSTEFTWLSSKGNGFRVDHIFLSPALVPRVRRVRYSHRERETRISDHSILLVNLVS